MGLVRFARLEWTGVTGVWSSKMGRDLEIDVDGRGETVAGREHE